MKKLYIIIFLFALISAKQNAFAKTNKQSETAARVVIINFSNLTGNNNYNWLTNSLANGIFNSMKERFTFSRIHIKEEWKTISTKEQVQLKNILTKKYLRRKDIRFILEKVKADIIIYGSFTANNDNKKITINANVFHYSVNDITEELDLYSNVDSSLFKAVDTVSKKIVSHIGLFALRSLKKQEAAKRLKQAKTKIVLKSAYNQKKPQKKHTYIQPYNYDNWYIHIGGFLSTPNGAFEKAKGLDVGPHITISWINSYKHLFHWGIETSFSQLRENDSNISGGFDGIYSYGQVALSGKAGLSIDIVTNRLLFIPYITAGMALQWLDFTKSDEYIADTVSEYVNPIASLGMQLALRISDIFITIGFNYARILNFNDDYSMLRFTAGVSF